MRLARALHQFQFPLFLVCAFSSVANKIIRPPIAAAMSTTPSSSSKKNLPRIDGETPVGSTKWLALKTLQWTDQEGESRLWDMATRTTKQASDKPDAVVIIPLLRNNINPSDPSSSSVDTLLVEQFRPPIGQVSLEFPAGLIDKDETATHAALRELREETGYVGEACKVPPVESRSVCMSPGFSNETVQVVVVEVDMSNPYNQNPKPELDPGEHVTVQRVPLQQGIQRLMDQGTSMPIMGLYLFAIGYELGASQNRMPSVAKEEE